VRIGTVVGPRSLHADACRNGRWCRRSAAIYSFYTHALYFYIYTVMDNTTYMAIYSYIFFSFSPFLEIRPILFTLFIRLDMAGCWCWFAERKILLASWWLVLIWCEKKTLLLVASKTKCDFDWVDLDLFLIKLWASTVIVTLYFIHLFNKALSLPKKNYEYIGLVYRLRLLCMTAGSWAISCMHTGFSGTS